MAMALALDAVRPAIAHVGQLSDRRLNHLWVSVADGFLDEAAIADAVERGGGLLRYTAAARAAELRLAAQPATLDVGPLDLGVEDHATNAPLSARLTDGALGMLEDVLAIELLTAELVARIRPTGRPLPAPIAAAFAGLRDARSGLGSRPAAAEVHAAVSAALCTEILDAAMDALPAGD
jgi:histidine ammonia-lyase